ncbi:MAG TPA: glycosyltransferase N-terminal domain-containing protein [Bacillota bacterium]|nr:glycosyltransferase N-terminal domain-containing protein [Bacillota bacterium]
MALGLFVYNLYLFLFGILSVPVMIARAIKKEKHVIKLPVPNRETPRTIWVLAESAGEVILAQTLITAFDRRRPDTQWLIITTTNSGYRMAQKLLGDFYVAYLPVDFPMMVKTLIKRFNPVCLLMIENFFWPNLLRQTAIHHIATAVVNARISDRVIRRNRFFRSLFRRMAQQVEQFYLQTETAKHDYLNLGVNTERLIVTGDLRFDRVLARSTQKQTEASLEKFGFSPDQRLVVAGSTHRGEESIILQAFERIKQVYPACRLLLAPRHLERLEEVGALLQNRGFHYQLFSKMQHGQDDVILLDTTGDLATLYGIAYLSIVGGSFVDGIGGHNILEPAAQGSPVFYGPYIEGFVAPHEVLSRAGIGFMVTNADELAEGCLRLLRDPSARKQIGSQAQQLMAEQRGVAAKMADAIHNRLSLVR